MSTTEAAPQGSGLKIEFGPRLASHVREGYAAPYTMAQGGVRKRRIPAGAEPHLVRRGPFG